MTIEVQDILIPSGWAKCIPHDEGAFLMGWR